MPTRLAVIADVHGNTWALRAVLDDIVRHGVDRIVNLGDVVYGPLDPAGTAGLLMTREIPTVRGNEDRILIDTAAPPSALATREYVLTRLAPEQIEWIRSFPPSLTMDGIYLCHGAPAADDEYLLEEVRDGALSRRAPGDVARCIAGVAEPLILCAHSHTAGVMRLITGRLVVNPGSVGCPAYTDDHPVPHVVQAGMPHARYSIVSQTADGWVVEPRQVSYDSTAAAEAASRNGREDWARWLLTGMA